MHLQSSGEYLPDWSKLNDFGWLVVGWAWGIGQAVSEDKKDLK